MEQSQVWLKIVLHLGLGLIYVRLKMLCWLNFQAL